MGYHHDYMAQKYIEVMSAALKAYDNGAHTDKFYEDLSWSGLQNTKAFRDKDGKRHKG